MRSIIRQNPSHFALPDFRNLGTILRTLLAANVLVAVGVLVRVPVWDAWPVEWMDSVAVVEPYLLLELMVLYAVAPWIGRRSYREGTITIAALTIAVGLVINALLERAGFSGGSLLRHLLFALLIVGLLLFYFDWRAKALTPAFTEARLQALQARIRPHFLFNSINAVLSLIRAEPKRAEAALEDMADLFRVLMRDNRDLAPLDDEVNLCRQYLALEQLRLGERLQLEWQLEGMPGDALVPPLVLQPLLENAIYHGIERSSKPGVVSIRIFCKDDEVHAILRNPFRDDGGRHHAGNKMALGNLRERLALHFDAEASLESSLHGDIYEAHIRMPYRKARPGSAQDRGPETISMFDDIPARAEGGPALTTAKTGGPRTFHG
jgi:two-component system sensor histidine kinase AlgZ